MQRFKVGDIVEVRMKERLYSNQFYAWNGLIGEVIKEMTLWEGVKVKFPSPVPVIDGVWPGQDTLNLSHDDLVPAGEILWEV